MVSFLILRDGLKLWVVNSLCHHYNALVLSQHGTHKSEPQFSWTIVHILAVLVKVRPLNAWCIPAYKHLRLLLISVVDFLIIGIFKGKLLKRCEWASPNIWVSRKAEESKQILCRPYAGPQGLKRKATFCYLNTSQLNLFAHRSAEFLNKIQ